MPRKNQRPKSKHTMNFYEGQFERLQELYPELGAAKVVRDLVDKHIRGIEEKLSKGEDLPKIENVEL